MKVFHVVNWHPTKFEPNTALWIKRHIQSLDQFVDKQYVLHLEVASGGSFSRIVEKGENGESRKWIVPTKYWFIIEILTTLRLLVHLIRLKVTHYDIINFHIAYPLLTYWHLLKKIFKKPTIITEHWSAYHFNFGVKKKLPRIQRIFHQKIPVIGVSEALINDIKKFSGANFQSFVVPNVVDERWFYVNSKVKRESYFFMVGFWKGPKDPIKIFKAFITYKTKSNTPYKLKVGGYGPLLNSMKKWVKRHNAQDSIQFIGSLNRDQVAAHMMKCKAFLHASDYETFSVVCAEAICCGTPVVASAVGGIVEFVNENNGVLVKNNEWESAILAVTKKEFNSLQIAQNGRDKFSREKVGKTYLNVLKKYNEGNFNFSSHT